jgi:hypothetical protein
VSALIDTVGEGQVHRVNEAALDFVRFCHRRRRVGWPELYDEICLVASRGLYHGWGFADLAEHGIAFGLAEMPRLAALVAQVVEAETDRPRRVPVSVMAPQAACVPPPAAAQGTASQAAEARPGPARVLGALAPLGAVPEP